MKHSGIGTARRPGIVMLAAALNFLWAFLFMAVGTSVALAALLWNLFDARRIEAMKAAGWAPMSDADLLFWGNVAAGVAVAAPAVLAVLFFFLAFALLKGSRAGWYAQVVLSVLGLFAVPFGTALSVLILVFFFREEARAFFRV